jgi:hypothetical protein
MKKSCLLLVVFLLAASVPSMAWGPHTRITQAAMDSLGADDAFTSYLGALASRMPAYSWMGDYQGGYMTEPDGSIYYADDYLLYPGVTKHVSHMCPDVQAVLEQHYLRAVQALRTETPANAARWVGSLLHFAEDCGAPPHAAGVYGPAHGPMEQWVSDDQIDLHGYSPRLLGAGRDEALSRCMKRIRELIAYSRVRGERVRPIVEAGNRKDAEPIILDCALETAKVCADLMHTLGVAPSQPSTVLAGNISPGSPVRPGRPTAKVVLMCTPYSTLADPSGHWEFHDLPPGLYDGRVLLASYELGRFTVRLTGGSRRLINSALRPSDPRGNLFRNPDFALRWITTDAPDDWHRIDGGWESNVVPVIAGRKYRLSVSRKPGVEATAALTWHQDSWPESGNVVGKSEISASEREQVVAAPESAKIAQLTIRTESPADSVCSQVALTPVD